MSQKIGKKLPQNKTDRRYTKVHRINQVRTKAWHHFVKLKSGDKKNSALARAFGNSQTAWDAYEKGERQPNDLFVRKVDLVLPGSGDVYFYGPDGLKLWAAITTKDARELYVIKRIGGRLENAIVRFRMAAMEGKIPLELDLYLKRKDPYELKLISIKEGLRKKIGDIPSELAFSMLQDEINLYKSIQISDYYNDIVGLSSYTKEDIEKMLLESEYFQIEIEGVKNKGAKLGSSLLPPDEIEVKFIRSELRLPLQNRKIEEQGTPI